MSDANGDFSKLGFVKTYVLPTALVFLIPVIALLFFLHAQGRFDAQAGEAFLSQVLADEGLSAEEKAKATAFFAEHPVSELIRQEPLASQADPTIRFYFATFRWMILLATAAIVSGVAVYLLLGVALLLSRRSQRAQYLSLAAGWQLLRLFGAFQVIVQGVLLVALSFWVTALWFNVYILKLILIVGLMAAVGAFAVVVAIFKRPRVDLEVEGKVIDRGGSPQLWRDLGAICEKVGTAPPDHVIVGVDDNFYVTENPVHIDGRVLQGRTLYVSLALLKQMAGDEADAVLAHEMAHFSGSDTLYSKKTAPLLARYGHYLQALHDNPIALPVFSFMNGFLALFRLSMGEQSRKREFRADRIAGETTTPRSLAGALMRISAYSDFRGKIQKGLFEQERALETVDIAAQLERGFVEHARSFAARPDLGELETAHPFDSHPPLAQRLEALGVPLRSQDVPGLVAEPGDGRWFGAIDDAEEVERAQWRAFEDKFRAFHEGTLAYRFLPETDEERAIVVKNFPEVTIDGKKGSLTLDCDGLHYSAWPGRVEYSEIKGLSLNDHTLRVDYSRGDPRSATIPTKTFGPRQAEALQAIQSYYGRYATAAAWRKQRLEEAPGPEAA